MSKCSICNCDFPTERLELGYDFCRDCSEANPKLCVTPVVILGQHKGQNLAFAPHDPLVVARVSYMVK